MSKIVERISQAIQAKNMSIRAFENSIGASNGMLSRAIKENKDINAKWLSKIIEAFPDIDADWLLSGDIKQTNDDKNRQLDELKVTSEAIVREPLPKYVTVDTIGNENILFVSTKASAGYLSGINDPEFLKDLPAYGLPGFQHGSYRAFEVQGDSMYQYQTKSGIHPGSWVIAQAVEKLDYIRDNRVYVVVSLDEGVIVKRCLNRLSRPDNPLLICQSDNKSGEYPNILLRPDQIREIWEFKAMITRHVPPPSDMYQTVNQLEADVIEIKEKLKNLRL